MSHPMWVRGLKLCYKYNSIIYPKSHPMWVRGLKQIQTGYLLDNHWSHPMWVRGLKRCILSDGSKHFEGVPSWN